MKAISASDKDRVSTLRGTGIRVAGILIGMIAALSLVAMTLITVTDVAGRYLFSAPLRGADELTVITLAVAVFSGLPLAIAQRGMISVEVLSVLMPPAMQRAARIFCDLVAGTFLAFCAWQIVQKAEKIAAYGDTTLFLRIPLAPLTWVIAVATFVSAAAFIGLALIGLAGFRRSAEAAE